MVFPDQSLPDVTAASLAECGSESTRLTSRSVRSFVIRNGRMTSAQSAALEELMPRYGIPYQTAPLDLTDLFAREAPVWLEIGFGNGDALVHMASQLPEVNFIGVEVHAPGVGHALKAIDDAGQTNVRIIQHDVMEVLQTMIPAESLQRVLLLFPDPWRKKRHFKRRIVQPEFIKLVASRLLLGGDLHCATDWHDYAEWMLEHLNQAESFCNLSPDNTWIERPSWRIDTRFEQRGMRLGHTVHDLLYQRCA